MPALRILGIDAAAECVATGGSARVDRASKSRPGIQTWTEHQRVVVSTRSLLASQGRVAPRVGWQCMCWALRTRSPVGAPSPSPPCGCEVLALRSPDLLGRAGGGTLRAG